MTMATNFLTRVATILALTLAVTTLGSCTQQHATTSQQATEENDNSTPTSSNQVAIKGSISHDTWQGDAATSVEFDAFPATADEWKAAQEKIGTEPQGAVALQVMAMELFRNNRSDGEQALRLNNTQTNYNSTVERLRELMGKDKYYARPYIAWALLEGATPENEYKIKPPYTISMKVDPNKKYQESQMLNGTVIYLLIDSKGWDTNWRSVEVVKPQDSKYYVVSNCPAIYTQCKQAENNQ